MEVRIKNEGHRETCEIHQYSQQIMEGKVSGSGFDVLRGSTEQGKAGYMPAMDIP